MLLLPFCAAQLITGVFYLDISLSCWFRGIKVPFFAFWSLFSSTRDAEGPGHCGSVFITEEVDGVGDKVRSTTAVVHKCFEASFNMFLRSASAAKVPDLGLNKFYYSTSP